MVRTIEVSASLEHDVATVCAAVSQAGGALFPRVVALHAPIGGGAEATQEVRIDVGEVRRAAGGVRASLRWRPVAHCSLLPVFDGELWIRPGRHEGSAAVVDVRGTYTAPFGPVGAVADHLVGRRVAEMSLQRLVDELVARIDRAPEPPPVRCEPVEALLPENYLG